MNNEQFQMAQAMNEDQIRVFNLITASIKKQLEGEKQRERIFVSGGVGTGKTFLLNVLKNQVNQCYNKSAVKVVAPTGVAARLVDGITLHCLLNLPVPTEGNMPPPLDDDYLRVKYELGGWEDIEFVFIDNISVISDEMLGMIDFRLQELKSQNDIFGGINILLFGDLLQLPPVQGRQVFQHPLWQDFRMFELKQNMRQQGDTTFIDILDALRVGHVTDKHLEILTGKVLTDASREFPYEEAIRIYPRNDQVEMHNERVIQYFQGQGIVIHTIQAQDHYVNDAQNLGNRNLEADIPDDINKTWGLPKVLNIFEGAKVMLKINIFERGLINGSIGIITKVIFPIVQRDHQVPYNDPIPSVHVNFGPNGVHIIEPIARQFPANSGLMVSRRMLPLSLRWASTVHKVQGCTVDKAVVYLGPRLFAAGQAYVALGCVKSLNGLQIEFDGPTLRLNDMRSDAALAEMQRLRNGGQAQVYNFL